MEHRVKFSLEKNFPFETFLLLSSSSSHKNFLMKRTSISNPIKHKNEKSKLITSNEKREIFSSQQGTANSSG